MGGSNGCSWARKKGLVAGQHWKERKTKGGGEIKQPGWFIFEKIDSETNMLTKTELGGSEQEMQGRGGEDGNFSS